MDARQMLAEIGRDTVVNRLLFSRPVSALARWLATLKSRQDELTVEWLEHLFSRSCAAARSRPD